MLQLSMIAQMASQGGGDRSTNAEADKPLSNTKSLHQEALQLDKNKNVSLVKISTILD